MLCWNGKIKVHVPTTRYKKYFRVRCHLSVVFSHFRFVVHNNLDSRCAVFVPPYGAYILQTNHSQSLKPVNLLKKYHYTIFYDSQNSYTFSCTHFLHIFLACQPPNPPHTCT